MRRGRLLVTGGTGLVGRNVVRAALAEGWRVAATHHTSAPGDSGADWVECDLRDPAAEGALATTGADAIVHTAYSRDDRRLIVEGTELVARVARGANAHMVHVSTDLVFAHAEHDYPESAEPAPAIDYGVWKLDAERVLPPGSAIVRTSLVVDDVERNGQQERLVLTALETPESVTFYTDEIRRPVNASELAAALCELAARRAAGAFHVVGPEVLNRAELAHRLAATMGLDSARLRSGRQPPGSARPARVVLADGSTRVVLETETSPVGRRG